MLCLLPFQILCKKFLRKRPFSLTAFLWNTSRVVLWTRFISPSKYFKQVWLYRILLSELIADTQEKSGLLRWPRWCRTRPELCLAGPLSPGCRTLHSIKSVFNVFLLLMNFQPYFFRICGFSISNNITQEKNHDVFFFFRVVVSIFVYKELFAIQIN